jgi:chitodextrinase
MTTTDKTSPCIHALVSVLMFTMLLTSSPVFAAGKKGGGGTTTKPPTPTNFRVTAKTAYTVTVAWDATSSSTAFNFHLSGAYNVTPVILASTARTHTFTALAPGNDYWFFIYARSSTGSVSGQANLGPVLLPRDTTPPWTAPVVSVGDVGANYANLSWTRAADDGPYHYSYELWINGGLLYRSDYPRNVTNTVLRFLEPATTYAVQIRTIDFGGNPSPLSAPATVTTAPANSNDTTPPTVPANVNAYGFGDGSTETQVSWTQSTDDFDDPANIRYDIYVNGRLEDWIFGSGGPRIIYSDFGPNLIEVFATDTAGNTSAAGTTTVFF